MNHLLATIQRNPTLNVEDSLKMVATEMGLSKNEISELQESFALLDKINMKAKELDSERKSGVTRDEWVQKELHKISGDSDSGNNILTEIEKGSQIGLDNILTQED